MKTPSHFAAPGHGPFDTLADQNERPMIEELALLRRHGLGCMGSLANLMLQATIVKTYERDSE